MESLLTMCTGAVRHCPPPGLALTASELAFFARAEAAEAFPFQATDHLMSLIDPNDPADPVRRQIVPTAAELDVREYEKSDPLAEARYAVAPRLVRRYENRCILKVAETCALHCRFCFRKGMLATGGEGPGREEVREAARYLDRHPEIREVLLTGGDPLTLDPGRLEEIMAALRKARPGIGLRIGTRLPVADPERLTDGLARLIAGFQPIWLTVHCNHPAELSSPAAAALGRLSSRGIRLGGQSVLLAGVNDDAAVLGRLFARQVEIGLRPYYLFHLDPAPGTSHFRVPLARGLKLMEETRVRFPRAALPVYALDLPGGGGKFPVAQLRAERLFDGRLLLRDPSGRAHLYSES